MTNETTTIDQVELRRQVKEMYRAVAETPHETFHFETGRPLTERLGYDPAVLDRVPAAAIESFAGVGHFFDLADLRPGERVLDLGSGSGTDAFVAAVHVGPSGQVVGIDMTEEQLAKARRLQQEHAISQVRFEAGLIERLPFEDGSFDAVISNGVINLAPDKDQVFTEAARVLRPGGRLALADIVTEEQLSDAIVSNVDLWASCIGGAPRQDTYLAQLEEAGFTVEVVSDNPYEFLSDQARGASGTYGVKSVSVLARRRG
jgi:arsenite methyltransferase